jgi:hypothetical protein
MLLAVCFTKLFSSIRPELFIKAIADFLKSLGRTNKQFK